MHICMLISIPISISSFLYPSVSHQEGFDFLLVKLITDNDYSLIVCFIVCIGATFMTFVTDTNLIFSFILMIF